MLVYPLIVGWAEIVIIVFVILLLFGGKKIPEMMKGLGKGVKSFKEGINEVDEQINQADSKPKESSQTDKGPEARKDEQTPKSE